MTVGIVYTKRGPHIVEMLAREDIPVTCHLGFVPRKSTWQGGLRAIGKSAQEAKELWDAFRRMEDSGRSRSKRKSFVSALWPK